MLTEGAAVAGVADTLLVLVIVGSSIDTDLVVALRAFEELGADTLLNNSLMSTGLLHYRGSRCCSSRGL